MTAHSKTPISNRRRMLFYLSMVVLTYGLLEIFSLLTFWVATGRSFSFEREWERQRFLAMLAGPQGELRIGGLLAQASFANPSDPDNAHWQYLHESSTQLTVRPRDPSGTERTVLRVPIRGGRVGVRARARLKPTSASPVFVSVASSEPKLGSRVLHAGRLQPGESLRIDESWDAGSEAGELELTAWFDETYAGSHDADVIFTELEVTFDTGQTRADAPRRDPFIITYALHPYVGFGIKPGISAPGNSHIRANEFGFFDQRPLVYRHAEDEVVVMLFGGSVAENLGHDSADTLKRELTASGALHGKRLTFINSGMRHYQQPQQLMLLNFILAQGAKIDVVVNLDGFNEIRADVGAQTGKHEATVPIFFPGFWPQMLGDFEDPDHVRLAGAAANLKAARVSWNRWFAERGPIYSVTAQLVWKLVDRYKAAAFRQALQAQPSRVPGERSRYPFPPTTYENGGERLAAHVGIWERSSLQMSQLAQANGIRYFHFLQPNQYVPGSKSLGPRERRHAYQEDFPYKRSVEDGYPVLLEAGRRLAASGVSFHDLSMIFRDIEEGLYVDPCCHFNERGSDIVAAEIAHVVRAALFAPAASTFRDGFESGSTSAWSSSVSGPAR